MIEFRCPTCNAKASAPDRKAGSTGMCRNCGTRIIVPHPHPQPVVTFQAAEGIETESDPEPPEPLAPPPTFYQPPIQPRMSWGTSVSRYPNLLRYLDWVKTSVLIGLILALIVAGIVVLAGFYFAVTEEILPGLAGVLVGLLIASAAYSVYTFYNALIEFVRVIIDIETNTREMNNNLLALGEQA